MAKQLWTITLPLRAIPKGRPRSGRGFTYTPKRTRDFETALRIGFMQAFRSGRPPAPDYPLGMTITFRLLRPKKPANDYPKPDLDNMIKTVDALNGLAWIDDSQLVEIIAKKEWSNRDEIEITLFDPRA